MSSQLADLPRGWLVLLAVLAPASRGSAVGLAIANPSFETPVYGDGVFDFLVDPSAQGAYGWTVTDGAAIYNALESDYRFANFNGTPQGGAGAQVGTIYGAADYAIFQQLAGPDAILGNGDDPRVAPGTDYALKVSVGQRFTGNPFTSFGGYDIQLIAGTGAGARIIGREVNVITPTPGSFTTRTIAVDCLQTLDPAIAGQPLTIVLRKTSTSSIATTDFDNVSLEAVKISPIATADFNELGGVNAVDLALWRAGFGGLCHEATHLDGNADTDGDVDGHDFLAWQRQLGSTPAIVSEASAYARAPEPSAMLLLSVAGIAIVRVARRSRTKESQTLRPSTRPPRTPPPAT